MAESLSWRKSCVKSESKSADEFSHSVSKLQRLVYRDTEEFRSELNIVLDELNSLDYSAHGQSEEVSDSDFRIYKFDGCNCSGITGKRVLNWTTV